MRIVRWILFLLLVATTVVHLGLREYRGNRLDAQGGHYFVTLGENRREVSAIEFQESKRLKALSWGLFWGSAAIGLALGLSIPWTDQVAPSLRSQRR